MGNLTSDMSFNLAANPNTFQRQRTYRPLDMQLPHAGLVPYSNPPTLLGYDPIIRDPAIAGTIQQGVMIPKVGIDLKAMGLLKSPAKPTTGLDGASKAAGIAGAAGQVMDLAGDAVASAKKSGPVNTWGIEAQTKAGKNIDNVSSALKGAGKGAAMGATIGSVIPGWGTAVGAVVGGLVGGVTGLLKSQKKIKDTDKQYKDNTQAAYENYNQKANAAQYAALAKYGTKLKINEKLKSSKKNAVSWHGKTFKAKLGGKLNSVGKVNIIPSGTLHKERNNLGNKDKGIPIIDEDGKKIFEVEREELILRLKTTKKVEDLVSKYQNSNNVKHLVDLGKLLSKEIMTNTHDYSGKFGMEVT